MLITILGSNLGTNLGSNLGSISKTAAKLQKNPDLSNSLYLFCRKTVKINTGYARDNNT